MSVTVTQAGLDELARYAPNVLRTCEIIKDFYGSQTVIDVTDRVVSWSVLDDWTTLVAVDWQMPSLAPIFANDDAYFNPLNADSIWKASPAKDPSECVMRVRLKVLTDTGIDELLDYYGHVLRVSISSGDAGATAELVTVFEPGAPDQLGKLATKKDGSVNDLDWKLVPPSVNNRTNKGGSIMPAVTVQSEPALRGGAPWEYQHYFFDVSDWTNDGLIELETGVAVPSLTGAVDQVLTWYERQDLTNPAAAGNFEMRFEKLNHFGPGNQRIKFYNPVSWHDIDPSACIRDVIQYAAGVNSQFWDSGSFTTQTVYFLTQSDPYALRGSVYDKTWAEILVDLLGYAPEVFLRVTWDTVIHIERITDNATSSYTFSDELENFVEIRGLDTYEDRLSNEIELSFNSHVDIGWHLERSAIIGPGAIRDSQGNIVDISKFLRQRTPLGQSTAWNHKRNRKPADFALSAGVKARKLSIDRPFFSADTNGFINIVDQFCKSWFKIYRDPIPALELVTKPYAGLPRETGDVIQLDSPKNGIDTENFLVVAKRTDIDSLEVVLTLYQISF